VPSVPFLHTHSVGVELLVQVVKKSDSLDNHGVDLVGGELELVTGERVGQTQAHGVEVLGKDIGDERGEVLADGTEDIVGDRVGDGRNVETRELGDGVSELGVLDCELDLLLVLEGVEHGGEHGGDLDMVLVLALVFLAAEW
jgi:hypothetical protein